MKTGTEQALQSAAKTGFDVLNQKKSLKQALKARGLKAIHRTGKTMEKKYRGGPQKRKRTKTPAAKKSRSLDTFD